MKKLFLLTYCSLLIFIMSLPKELFSQNVGVGITNPTRAKLELNGSVGATNAIFGGETTGISLQSNWPSIGFNQYYNNGSKYIANGYAAVQYLNPATGEMAFDMFGPGNANTNVSSIQRAFTIANNGNIGIRTNVVNASLYAVKAGNFDGTAVFGGSFYNSHFKYGVDEHTYIRSGKNGGYVYLNDIPNGSLVLGGGNTMVGINSGNPTYTLEMRQTSGKGLLLVDPDFNFNNWEYVLKPSYHFPGESNLDLNYNQTPRGGFRPNGEYHYSGSDRRIKKNIRTIPSLLDKIRQLNPVEYEMKDHKDNHEKTFGFIAQDVKLLFPELVSVNHIKVDSVNRIPDLHSLNYTGFSVIAIKALQEQYKQIQALQKENVELMKRLEKLDEIIAAGISASK